MNLLQRSLIEKAGHDHGFEHVVASEPGGVLLASAKHTASAQVVAQPAGAYLLRLQTEMPALLPEMSRSFPQQSQINGFSANTVAGLATLLRRAAGLARALPSQVVNDYEATVANQLAQLPADLGGTEVERLVRQRIGQQKFRDAMLDYWGGACAVTAVAFPEVLRASHAKPWAECASDAERLDVFNGFLLVANLDALFDRFLISFDDDGRLLISPILTAEIRIRLGLHPGMALRWLTDAHRVYLAWHRLRLSTRLA
ncbi:HNH endonuclease [Massilia forsythiae]|uniref:HNH endonuclease n=1 Tax=Massilia forsythiae TaxID=2728020 RepID=A0A7Z2ZSM2_9BURK|nr:HNH endonuclease [Massilia forsythiae]QJE00474.1 HNH endonuclease [Massilia forsythiae]